MQEKKKLAVNFTVKAMSSWFQCNLVRPQVPQWSASLDRKETADRNRGGENSMDHNWSEPHITMHAGWWHDTSDNPQLSATQNVSLHHYVSYGTGKITARGLVVTSKHQVWTRSSITKLLHYMNVPPLWADRSWQLCQKWDNHVYLKHWIRQKCSVLHTTIHKHK